MTITKNFSFDFRFVLVFILGVIFGLFLGFNNSVYAYQYGDSQNDFNNVVNTMSEFTSLNNILKDTSYADSSDYIKNKINDDSFSNVYLVSYYNSGVDPARSYKSLDLICVPDGVSFTPVFDSKFERLIEFNFRGSPGQVVFVRHHGSIFASNISLTINEYGYGTLDYSKFVIRSLFDISNYHDFNQMLPNYFLQSSFNETNFITNIFNSVDSFGWYIALMVSLFIVLYILNKKLGLGFGFNYRGGVKI